MTNTKHKQPHIEINDQFRYALDIMENGDRSIFITGRAGTLDKCLYEMSDEEIEDLEKRSRLVRTSRLLL